MLISRDIEAALQRFSKFPVVIVLGPRQSGKTTVVQKFFPNHRYINLEEPEALAFVTADPKRFLREYENDHGIIIDEFQYAPAILSYIQIASDTHDRPGYFVLTGSQNFLMNQAITQSLAGRAGILHLMPFSINELVENNLLPQTLDTLMFQGAYPRIYAKKLSPRDLFPAYVQTYIERDVRQLINVENLLLFQKFMQLCAARVGQLLNISDLAMQTGITQKIAQQWLSILDASYIIFLLKPYFNNFTKRLTKTPKLYFYDTGLACSLLNMRAADTLMLNPFRGPLFENLIIADLYKQFFNLGFRPSLYFWRDQNGRIEIDGLIDLGNRLVPLEIKSGETINSDFFTGVKNWSELAKIDPENAYIIYGGDSHQSRSNGTVISWRNARTLIAKLEEV
jgi:predicted AAA+ superfamily ATPase